MTTTQQYIDSVIDNIPLAMPNRSEIAMELQSHIAERAERGQSMDEIVRHLGDPVALAESYLAAVPLVAATFGQRALAKLVDLVLAVCMASPLIWLAVRFTSPLLVVLVPLSVLAFCVYIVIAEYRRGQTVGKRALGLCVVRESGARITLGQSIVRQLPLFLQVFWIDGMFALFTEKSQRAFELLSRTRVVRVEPGKVQVPVLQS